MQPDNSAKLAELEQKIDAIYKSVEKTRKYLFWTFVVSIVVVVLPAIGLVFVLPSFISNYTSQINSLSQ